MPNTRWSEYTTSKIVFLDTNYFDCSDFNWALIKPETVFGVLTIFQVLNWCPEQHKNNGLFFIEIGSKGPQVIKQVFVLANQSYQWILPKSPIQMAYYLSK